METFSQNLKKLRNIKGLTQLELGMKCVPQFSVNDISKYENGRKTGYDQLVRVKKAVNCSFDELMREEVN